MPRALSNTDPVLRRCWHPVARSGDVAEQPHAVMLLGEPWVLYRSGDAVRAFADNFLDIARFPFVHAGTFGTDEAAEVDSYAVARDDWSFTVAYEHPFAHREDPGVAAGLRPLVQTRRLTYRLSAPFHLWLRIVFVDSGGSNVIGFFIQPETDETCRRFTTLWRADRATLELRRVLADLAAAVEGGAG